MDDEKILKEEETEKVSGGLHGDKHPKMQLADTLANVVSDNLALADERLADASGGDDLRGGKVPKYRCERCGQKYALPKGPNGMNCLVCGGKLVFIGVE